MKKLLLISSLILLISNVNAQMVYKSGGTSNSTFLLGYASYAAKSQCIFLPVELTNAQSGSIVRIYYKYGSTNNMMDQTLTNFEISMGQTTATSYDGSYTFFTGLSQVFFSSSYTITGGVTGTWFSIDLNTPFTYDVSQTLIIQIKFATSAIDAWGTYGTTNTPTRKIISSDVNAITGDPSSGTWQDMGFDLAPVDVKSVSSPFLAMTVFPNPVKDKLTIQIPGIKHSGNVSVSLLNNLGESVLTKEILTGEISTLDVSKLARGIYFLKAKLDDNEVIRKIILE